MIINTDFVLLLVKWRGNIFHLVLFILFFFVSFFFFIFAIVFVVVVVRI